jgi:amylosucrase
MSVVEVNNPHLLSFVRINAGNRVIVVGNFSEEPQQFDGNRLRTAGLGRFFEDAITGRTFSTSGDVQLDSYEILWLSRV